MADVIPPLPAPNPPVPNHRREQPLYKPPMDRHNAGPSPRGAAVNHASHQPLPRSDSNDAWASEAPIAAGRAYGQVPFAQQNKQQLPVQQKAEIKTAGAGQRAQAGQGRGQILAPRAEPASQPSRAPPVYEADNSAPTDWTCPICTYHHQDKEAGFLSCAICAHTRGTPV